MTNLSDLCGKHVLTGVDCGSKIAKQEYGDDENCNTITFCLDGLTYCATEDPIDGYRSCMSEIVVVADPPRNTFPPCRVVGKMRADDSDKNDTLELIDVTTGKVVLAVGTDTVDGYYPTFVSEWTPENMAINAKVK